MYVVKVLLPMFTLNLNKQKLDPIDVYSPFCPGWSPQSGPLWTIVKNSAGKGMKFHPSESHLFLAFYSGEITPFIPASCYPLRTQKDSLRRKEMNSFFSRKQSVLLLDLYVFVRWFWKKIGFPEKHHFGCWKMFGSLVGHETSPCF